MKNLLIPLVIVISVGLEGCASLLQPSIETLNKVPIVQFGDNIPANGDFILYFPAGKPIPVVASVKGSALSTEAENTLNVTLKKDIYAYKYWVSFDRKTWRHSDEVIDVIAAIKIPSPEYPKPGLMTLQVNLK